MNKGVLGEICQFLEGFDDVLPVLSPHFGIEFFIVALLVSADLVFKLFALNTQYHVCKHLYEAPVGVVGKAWIVGFPGQARRNVVIEAEVQNGIHHSRHGNRRAGPNREQQRVFRVPEAGAHFFLHQVEGDAVFLLEQYRQPIARFEEFPAGRGGDNKTEGHR